MREWNTLVTTVAKERKVIEMSKFAVQFIVVAIAFAFDRTWRG